MLNLIRVQDNTVVEVLEAEEMPDFHSSLDWRDVTELDPQPQLGWTYDSDEETYAEPVAHDVEVERQQCVDAAHDEAWNHIHVWYDIGGLLRFQAWTDEDNANQVGKDMIGEIKAWIDGVMAVYLFGYKPALLAGATPTIDFSADAGDAPYSFTEVLVACNTPWFTTQPTNQSVAEDATATFTTVTSGYPGRVYQWQRSNDSGSTWSNITDATTEEYEIETTSGDNGAQFRCKCQLSAVMVATSDVATLTVT